MIKNKAGIEITDFLTPDKTSDTFKYLPDKSKNPSDIMSSTFLNLSDIYEWSFKVAYKPKKLLFLENLEVINLLNNI